MRAGFAVAAAAALVAGCSSSGGGVNTAQARLRVDMSALASAAAAHDTPMARQALTRLQADVQAALASGTLDAADAARITAAATAVRTDLATSPTPTPSRTTSTTTSRPKPTTRPAPAPKPEPKRKPHGGKKHGD